jgi:hypothetical protein
MFHLFLEPQRQQITEVIDESATPEGAFDSLVTAVGELVSTTTPVYFGARRLLESQTPPSELDTMFIEFKEQYGQPETPAGLPANHVE